MRGGDLAVTMTQPVVLPSATAAGGGLLAQADPVPGGWTRGAVDFATDACLAAGTHVYCATSPTEKEFQGFALAAFEAFVVEVGVTCTTLSGRARNDEAEAKARRALSVKAEFSVGSELATGAVTGNPSLADATGSGSAATAAEALAILEDAIATNLRGDLAFVHATPARLVELVGANVLYRDFDSWRTPSGHLVIASPGYVGNIDDELVATTPVYASLGEIDPIRTFDRELNQFLAVTEAPAIAVFDDCFNESVAITTSP
jgi:hypothetical protein